MTDTPPASPRWPETLEDIPGLAEAAKYSGIEMLEAIRTGRLPSAPMSRTVNFLIHTVETGRVVFRGEPGFDVYNPLGSVHGGWYGVMLDSAMGSAIHTHLPAGKAYTTLEYKVNILRGARADSGPMLAIGESIHVGRSTGTAQGRLVGEADGRLYATATTTCLIMDFA
ncbi:PaaI family thioesterase [uncultured Albimonas sp.]|mgnify:CR=1 FL=1|uniref:PaaI family thioesterase n=1 Tax=uncultured Albimonas sp. TaxID=1331701 RepID=UPI0030EC24EA|tara:strand:+ start:1418 stop:1924 length:507 start_codon:yes stop_codon:yes gene_type:complete